MIEPGGHADADTAASTGVAATNAREQQRVQALVDTRHGPRLAVLLAHAPVWARDFTNLHDEWRR